MKIIKLNTLIAFIVLTFASFGFAMQQEEPIEKKVKAEQDDPITNETIKVYLGTLKNNTNKELKFYQSFNLTRTELITAIPAKQQIVLNQEINLKVPLDRYYSDKFFFATSAIGKFEINILYDKRSKEFYAFLNFPQHDHVINISKALLDLSRFNKKLKILINIDFKEYFRNSKIEFVVIPEEAPSLFDQSIKVLAEKVINKKMTLEQVQKVVPAEVYEKVIEYINKKAR
jgi:hypothetical protein